MTLLARLRRLEHDVATALQAGRAPDVESVRLLDEIMAGTLRPEPHEEAAVRTVLARIRRQLGFGTLSADEDEGFTIM